MPIIIDTIGNEDGSLMLVSYLKQTFFDNIYYKKMAKFYIYKYVGYLNKT